MQTANILNKVKTEVLDLCKINQLNVSNVKTTNDTIAVEFKIKENLNTLAYSLQTENDKLYFSYVSVKDLLFIEGFDLDSDIKDVISFIADIIITDLYEMTA
jgi:hypothetical protein